MSRFDRERFALESATGGRNTLILDDLGLPSVMVKIPKCRWSDIVAGGPPTTCSAFIVNGKEVDYIYVSKYQNVVEGGRAYSLPGRDPAAWINFDQAKAACEAKGKGWHLLSNSEWMLLAHWCKTNGTIPRGNNYCGRDVDHAWEHGVQSYDWIDANNWNNMANYHDAQGYHHTGRTLTGSGPASWRHDGTPDGVCDLNGNVWEWTSGLRLMNGEIQIIPDNNSAAAVDESRNSNLWRAILQDGSLALPGAANTLKYNGSAVGNATQADNYVGAPVLDIKNDKPAYTGGNVDDYYGELNATFESVAAASGVTVPQLLKDLGIFPVDNSLNGDYFWIRNYGERLPFRGGSFWYYSDAGVFALDLDNPRAGSWVNVGFRAAFCDL
jgi:hypothetical protein